MKRPDPPPDPPPGARPASPAQMFRVFNALALQGFGGVLAVAQRELVERQGWMSKADFLALLSLAQVLPGPNVINMALIIGQRFHGWRGALASLAGMLLAPLAIVLALAALYGVVAQWPVVAGALRGMGVVAAGLVIATALKLSSPLRHNPLGLPRCWLLAGAAFVTVGVLRWPLVWVLLGLGAVGVAMAWRQVRA